MADYCNSCNQLKKEQANVYANGITNAVCDNLGKNKGFNPNLNHENCEDLKLLNDCKINQMLNKIDAFGCDWQDFVKQLGSGQLDVNEALICWLCGLENRFSDLEDKLQDFYSQFWVIETRYNAIQGTPGFTITLDRQGNFTFTWKDWGDSAETILLGTGTINGKVNFCMDQGTGASAIWRVRTVYINQCRYVSGGSATAGDFTIRLRVPNASGTIIYTKTHNTATSFTDTINQTVNVNLSGVVDPSTSTPWQTVAHFYNDGSIADDEGNIQVRFINNNATSVPRCG